MKTYEGMFLLDAGNPDFEAAAAPIRQALDRVQAEVVSLKPWDDRRLAYDIQGRKRGLYVLTYFKADPARMTALQHEIQLDERILRAMVLSADHVGEERIRAETPATLSMARQAAERARAEARAAEAAAAASGQSEPPPPPKADSPPPPVRSAPPPKPDKPPGQDRQSEPPPAQTDAGAPGS